ncbi:MAG: hypothetical protein ACC608_04660 [Anaerofustis sp.]
MSDNLKITTPLPPNDPVGKIRPKETPGVLPQIDPNKVTSKTQQQQDQKQSAPEYQFNQQSVFNKFLQQFQQSAQLSNTLKKLLFDAFLRQDNQVSQDKLDKMLSTLASKFQIETPQQLNKQIRFLQENNTKFSGDFFELLRGLYSQTKQSGDNDFASILGQFLKAYDHHTSAKGTLAAIMTTCNDMVPYLRKASADKMQTIMQRLLPLSGEPQKAAVLLKEEMMPFLKEYINTTNDMGKVRDMIALVVHNLSRLNSGTMETVRDQFDVLMDYCRFNLNLATPQLKRISAEFEALINKPEIQGNDYFDSFVDMVKSGIKDNPSAVSRAMYQDIANALLIDQSTFMPLTHVFLPLNYNGTFLFSEMWIDRQLGEGSTQQDSDAPRKNLRIFLTFDIQDLGYFETVIQLSGKTAGIYLNYPDSLKIQNKEIKDAVGSIFSQSGFEVKNLFVSAGSPAQKLDQVFPNIYERKQSVNVSI